MAIDKNVITSPQPGDTVTKEINGRLHTREVVNFRFQRVAWVRLLESGKRGTQMVCGIGHWQVWCSGATEAKRAG